MTVIGVDYHCALYGISKSKATQLLENSILEEHGYIYDIYIHDLQVLNFLTIELL